MVKGLSEEAGQQLVCRLREHGAGAYTSVQQLVERTGIRRRELDALASAGALASLAGHRHKCALGGRRR